MKALPFKGGTVEFLPRIITERYQERPLFAEADEIVSIRIGNRFGGRGVVSRRYLRKET